jgi:hypothetical protein
VLDPQKDGVRQERRRFFLCVQPHRLYHAFIFADLDWQLLRQTQLLKASKAGKRVSIIAGVKSRHCRRRSISNVNLRGNFQARSRIS